MIGYGLLVTPLLISVQDFAFRGRPMSLLVAYAPAGSHLFRFSRRSFRLALQSTARSNYIHETYVSHHYEKIRTSWILQQESPFIIRISLQLKYFCPTSFVFTFPFAVSKLSPVSL
jgi:hypothetical protein